MHWDTCKSLLNTLKRAVEQFAGCLVPSKEKSAVEVRVYNSHPKPVQRVKVYYEDNATVSKQINLAYPDSDRTFQYHIPIGWLCLACEGRH